VRNLCVYMYYKVFSASWKDRPVIPRCLLIILLAACFVAGPARAQQAAGATFGNVIQLAGGTPADIVLDEPRQLLYLISNSTSQVLVIDYTTGVVVNSIGVGKSPVAGALSMDGNFLYVTSGATPTQTASGTPLLNVIDLNQGRIVQSVVLPSIPQGVEVGNDGRALVSMLGSGVVSGIPQGTLAVFDRTLNTGQQLLPVTVPALPTTPAPLPATTLTRPTKIFTGSLLRTPDGQFIVGVITPTAASTYIFVYEVASGVVLRNRTIGGASTVLAMSPDGSRFMAGMTMYDTATLGIVAQQNNANAPFSFTGVFNTLQNIGGSVFTPDGTALYSAFNTAANTNPPPPSLSSTLLINDPTNLGIRLGIRLPESIVAKMVMLSDGSEAWGLSDSGVLHLPLGRLFEYPILQPETTTVFLANDDCNRGIATGTLHINNLGKGRLTFAVVATGNSAMVYQQSSGLAPASIKFTMEPGRSGVVRQPGTNIWTGAGTSTGAPVNVTLSSPEAINIPPVIRVYMNYRQSDQRGVIFPVPTTPNNSPNNVTGNTSGNEGLQDLVLDEARGRLYLTNSGYNRIEVFDLQKQHFVDPIPVGQLPHQMALASDGKTLYVGNTGGESISIVDLDQGRVVDSVAFPPIPRNGTVALVYPRTLAVGLFGLQFVMSDGSQWKVVNGNQATVRPADSVTPVRLAGGPAYGMVSTPDNSYILTLNGSGIGYLYNAAADTYVGSRQLFTGTIQGYYGVIGAGPAGSFFLADGLILNPALTVIGGSAQPGATVTGPSPVPGFPGATTIINTGQRNVASVAPLNTTTYLRLTTPVRQNITTATRDDSRTTLEMVNLITGELTLAGVAPENPQVNVFGTTRFNTNPRQMVVDSAGTTAYAITLSGLSVISLAPTGADTRPAITAGARGIVNASDGTATIKPGSFITINGSNLAAAATADIIPPPTVLGGSCVTFGDVAVPLLVTANGQIQAQVPDTIQAGTQVVAVRSLATAQASDPVTVSVKGN
jgi:DNA-binding beta-propeller fold protein YncE